MAMFYLVRHGEPDYDTVREAGFRGFGVDFAPLTERGVAQAENAAQDPRLKTARLIVSSPYPRALQTAQIISRATGLKVAVELDLREWIPDDAAADGMQSRIFRCCRNDWNGNHQRSRCCAASAAAR